MHLTENCTGPSETAMKGVLSVGKCNASIEEKRQEKFADTLTRPSDGKRAQGKPNKKP